MRFKVKEDVNVVGDIPTELYLRNVSDGSVTLWATRGNASFALMDFKDGAYERLDIGSSLIKKLNIKPEFRAEDNSYVILEVIG